LQIKIIAIRLAILAVIVAFWQVAPTAGWIDPGNLPPASEVVQMAWQLLRTPLFLSNLLVTGERVITAFIVAAPIAVLFGIVIGERLATRQAIEPALRIAISIPQSIFLPVFILAFGIGFEQKVIFGATHVVFVVMISTVAAVRSIPSSYGPLALMMGASRSQVLWRFYIPAILPYLMTGLRLGFALDVVGVLLAEMYGSKDGVGLQIFTWSETLHTTHLFAAILIVSVATIVLNEAMRALENYYGRWRHTLP
jgi:NitT/TauT family transport system permease protein